MRVALLPVAALATAALTLAACTSGSHPAHPATTTAVSPGTAAPAAAPPASTPLPSTPLSSSAAPRSSTASTKHSSSSRPSPALPSKRSSSTSSTTSPGSSLPLSMTTGAATRVITVVADSTGSTTATLQAWQKSSSGWLRYGSSVTAHVGSDGLSSHPSESRSATPIGSFTLTQAFGRDVNPGTSLPYRHTTPADWWISQSGPLYNTLQHCSSSCSFTRGNPNEHLYYETPFYDYAVVIDYNTRNAGPVRQGAGSAFFLHVTDGNPTAGCVSIPMAKLVTIMKWLTPSAHPRILIGIG